MDFVVWRGFQLLSRFGGDLLSHVLRRSTIGVSDLNGRVRDGIGCLSGAMTTKPRKELNIRLRACTAACFPKFVFCAFGLVLLLLEQIKPIEQLVPVS